MKEMQRLSYSTSPLYSLSFYDKLWENARNYACHYLTLMEDDVSTEKYHCSDFCISSFPPLFSPHQRQERRALCPILRNHLLVSSLSRGGGLTSGLLLLQFLWKNEERNLPMASLHEPEPDGEIDEKEGNVTRTRSLEDVEIRRPNTISFK